MTPIRIRWITDRQEANRAIRYNGPTITEEELYDLRYSATVGKIEATDLCHDFVHFKIVNFNQVYGFKMRTRNFIRAMGWDFNPDDYPTEDTIDFDHKPEPHDWMEEGF